MQPSHSLQSYRFLALFLFAIALFTGCDSSSSPDGPALSTTMPTGWSRKPNYPVAPGVSADYVDFAPRNSDFSANAMLLTGPSSGQSPASAVAEGLAQLQANPSIADFVIDSNSAVTIGGKEGYRLQFRYAQLLNGTRYALLQRQLLVIHKGMDCQLVLTRLQSDSIAGASGFRAIEASIKLN